MDKYPACNFLLNIFIHNKLPIWVGWLVEGYEILDGV